MPSLPIGPNGARVGGQIVPVVPNFAQRVSSAVRYAITGVTPTTWFGPFQPLEPFADPSPDAGVKGRRYDYPTGRNLSYTPRSESVISFADLRALSSSCDILRGVLEACKDQIAALDWVIRPKPEIGSSGGASVVKLTSDGSVEAPTGLPTGNSKPTVDRKDVKPTKDLDPATKDAIRKITDFLSYPDRDNSWDQWSRMLNEDMFVIDAATIWKRRTRGGDLYSLEVMDGATIFPLLGADGRKPSNPGDPCFQQILHGVPAADYTADELMYLPRNQMTNRVYGLSSVEQVVITVNTAIRRAIYQLEYYLSGTNPDAFVGLPDTWNLQNIKDFQAWFDSMMEGNLAARRKTRFMPGQFKYVETKEPPLKDDYDEWLARVICFVLGVSPEPFIHQMNRATAGASRSRALEDGLLPRLKWWKSTIDRVIRYDFKRPDLEFVFLEDRETDPKTQMEIDTGYTKQGIRPIDEVRQERGWLPFGGPAADPMLATSSGYVPLGALTGPNAAAALASSGSPGANATQGTKTGDDGGTHAVKPPNAPNAPNATSATKQE